MRHLAFLVLAASVALASGCSSRAYFTDRWRDTKDIFTASVGTGGGAKARVGPFSAGLFLNSDFAGLRAGEGFYLAGSIGDRTNIMPIVTAGPDSTDLTILIASIDDFAIHRITSTQREKEYSAEAIFFGIADSPSYYTQIEVAAGLGGTLRLGFNPGELLDFLLGWTTLDIYGDDLGECEGQVPGERAPEPSVSDTPSPEGTS